MIVSFTSCAGFTHQHLFLHTGDARMVHDLLMKAAAETTLSIATDPRRLGARIGITAVLHTWGSALTHHPHAPPETCPVPSVTDPSDPLFKDARLYSTQRPRTSQGKNFLGRAP
jgi:hypothetical protein